MPLQGINGFGTAGVPGKTWRDILGGAGAGAEAADLAHKGPQRGDWQSPSRRAVSRYRARSPGAIGYATSNQPKSNRRSHS